MHPQQSDDNLAEIKSMAASLQPTKPVIGNRALHSLIEVVFVLSERTSASRAFVTGMIRRFVSFVRGIIVQHC